MPNRPTVTVLTPTYNRPHFIESAVRSVLTQRLVDWEMLVINDGGVDVEEAVMAVGDERVRYFNRDENRGKAACLNFGLQHARGQYIAYLDDDDVWYPQHLSTLAEVLDARAQIGVAYSDLYKVAVVVDEDGHRYPLQKSVDICRDFNRMFMFHFNHTLHVSLMHRRDLLERAGGYDESVRVLIDWNLTRKLAYYTDFAHVEAVTGEYYVPVSGSDRISDVQRRDRERFLQNMRRIRADIPPEPWPHVAKVAVVLSVDGWQGGNAAVVRYLLDKTDYPARFVFVVPDVSAAQQALGEEAKLPNVETIAAPAGMREFDRYMLGAAAVDAEFYYLPSTACSRNAEMRIIRALAYAREHGAQPLRWPQDPPESMWDVFVPAEALHDGASWQRAREIPWDWYPPALHADMLLQLAKGYEEQGDYAAAKQLLQQVSRLGEGGVGDAFLVRRWADLSFAQGDYDDAERLCRQLIMRGYGADNWIRLGRIHQSKGENAAATLAYRRGLEAIGLAEEDLEASVFPLTIAAEFDVFRGYAGLGECLVELGKGEEAARCLHRAARLRPLSHRPALAFGKLFLQQGQLAQAQDAFLRAASRAPRAARGQVECGLAEICLRLGDTQQAFSHWCNALQAEPDNLEYLSRADSAGRKAGRLRELEALFRRFLDYRPGNVDALLGLAALLMESGRGEQARELAERALVLSPGNEAARRIAAQAGCAKRGYPQSG